MDLGHFQLKQPLDQSRMGAGNDHLRAFDAPAHFHQIDLQPLAFPDGLVLHLLGRREDGLGLFSSGAQLQDHRAVAGIDAGDGAVEDFVLFGGKLIGHHAPFGFPDALDDHLLCRLGGDTAEFAGVDVDADLVAHRGLGGILERFLQRDLGGRVEHFVHHGFDSVHGDGAGFRVDLHKYIIQSGALGVFFIDGLVGGGQSLGDAVQHIIFLDALFLFQIGQGLHQFSVHFCLLLLSFNL